MVEERGEFSVRGGVIDLFPPLYPQPVRLEFWGDEVESIRLFDPATQRSQGTLEDLMVLPASEVVLDERRQRTRFGPAQPPARSRILGPHPRRPTFSPH